MKRLFLLFMLFLHTGLGFAQQNPISETVLNDIRYMREEEKLARDVYDSMYLRWQLTPFKNIRQSETMHMKRMKELIEIYQISDPVQSEERGVFTNNQLKMLYHQLIETGSQTALDALKIGARIEEIDIQDLLNKQKNTNDETILSTYRVLLSASERHLNAFVRNLKMRNVIYQPVVLRQATFDEIIGRDAF
ncbi:MAG TPA: DUF2202 domain-containing protein [Ferruginibacter sp.]|nr:DUF2202 domain-containing protein [Ferruginibacter sp.]